MWIIWVPYLFFIHKNLCPLHLDVAVFVADQKPAWGLLHPASLSQELSLFGLGWALFHTLAE